MDNPYARASFLKSAAELRQLPADGGIEVAFAGRSNSGKSSALNAITGRRALARISKTPGRTQLINIFPLDEYRRLVDLPGYGYARVPANVKAHWERVLPGYLSGRQCLRGLILVMDIRHPLRAFDQQMLAWCEHAGLPLHILLNKADKLGRGAAADALRTVRGALAEHQAPASAQTFSATRGSGTDAARAVLDDWFADAPAPGD